jgi:oligopeptide transport system substrate-binding protein
MPREGIVLGRALYRGEEFVNRVISIPGTRVATTLVPSSMKGVKDAFVKEYPAKPVTHDLQEAKKYLELAKKEMGGTIPPIRWLTSDTEVNTREAEYFQALLKAQLGIDLMIDKQIPKQRFAKMTAGDFDIASTGWGADYNDPMTYADLNASWNDANRGRYHNPEFDRLIRAAQESGDQKFRMKTMAQALQLALDDVSVIPLYERVQAYLISDRVQGLVRNTVGLDPDFRYARVTAGK